MSSLSGVSNVLDQVRLILQERGVEYELDTDAELRIAYGSAHVGLRVRDFQGATVIVVKSRVLTEVPVEGESECFVLRSLNDRNRSLPFGKFYLDAAAREVIAEYEIVGDHLQDAELMNAVVSVARMADDHDDLMQEEFRGGRRAVDRAGEDEAAQPF